ncbi:DinB family protein [Lewinella sp. IMCC34191]|uniref:DinB family protein n=1 Tax=Lewinella sp. IMCC34191 TaxID=2259172 RepID=UPI000E27AFB6|nr:DinB family protein [Lewinella sp. IMCC34191]
MSHSLCISQYRATLASRQVLFAYCASLDAEDFLRPSPSFGNGGSMRSLLVHVVNTYQYWVLEVGLSADVSYTDYREVETVEQIVGLFTAIDAAVFRLLNDDAHPESDIFYERDGKRGSVTRLAIFTHVMTHEFHHKGQILSLSRELGYTPVDTDIIRSAAGRH